MLLVFLKEKDSPELLKDGVLGVDQEPTVNQIGNARRDQLVQPQRQEEFIKE